MARILGYLIVAVVLGQAAYGGARLVGVLTAPGGSGLVAQLTRPATDRIRDALGDDAAILELLAATVPDSAMVIVDWPATFSADRDVQGLGDEVRPILDWVQTIERVRVLTYPRPTIFRMLPNGFAAAENLARSGADVWMIAPGAAHIDRIRPLLPAVAAQLPAAFGIPEGRAGWKAMANNPRCQLWRLQKD